MNTRNVYYIIEARLYRSEGFSPGPELSSWYRLSGCDGIPTLLEAQRKFQTVFEDYQIARARIVKITREPMNGERAPRGADQLAR